MGNLIAAVVASAILGAVAIPITMLTLQTVTSRADAQLFSSAETLALGIRRKAAQADSLEVANGALTLTTDGTQEVVSLPDGCSVSSGAADPAVNTVTCVSARGSRRQSSTQPLLAKDDFRVDSLQGLSNVCYKYYRNSSDLSRDRDFTIRVSTLDAFNELVAANREFFRLLDPAVESGCATAGKFCVVGDYEESPFAPFASDPAGRSWNDQDAAGVFRVTGRGWSSRRMTPKDQSPDPGDLVDCASSVTLEF